MRHSAGRIGLWIAIALAGGFSPAGTAVGQVHPLRVFTKECLPAGCRLAESRGSAVAIGRQSIGRELFLTAGHCVRGDVTRVEVGIGRQWRAAVILGRIVDERRDLAVVAAGFGGQPLACAPLAGSDAAPGTPVLIAGFPRGGDFRKRDAAIAPSKYLDVDLVVNAPTVPGESGGGIFTGDGALVGIISATGPLPRPDHTLATGVGRIRSFLHQAIGVLPECGAKERPADRPLPPTELAALLSELAALRKKVAELESRTATAGPSGPRGPPGEPGPPGPAGELDGELRRRIEELSELRIPVQILAADGTVLDQASYRLGEPIRLKLMPKEHRASLGNGR